MGFYLLPKPGSDALVGLQLGERDIRAVAPCGMTNGAYWAPGILATFGLIMLNIIS